MTIKHLGEVCPNCKKDFDLLSLPVTCAMCHGIMHRTCTKDSFILERLDKLNFNKDRICYTCLEKFKAEIKKDEKLQNIITAYEKGYSSGYDAGFVAGRNTRPPFLKGIKQ
ncbi:FYVE zinc finger domain-containing protein [Desulfobotulus mexicanus]|uniref:Uncharacterized protein n=1 Tax=Desulfobotulus mexicanus TaxID=2586642 RepID=A0A5Q4VFS6_9BACT|nr:FYVE zinc finger domain-containing protein [Desulfobotulus mexicanus]TYT75227.1 hypothetical protein FIM25_05845 [Desulfobotulus mexicanus]